MSDIPHLIHLAIDGICWLVAEEDRERLLAAARSGWSGQVQRIAPQRRVVQIEGKAGPLLLKHFRTRGMAASLKVLLRGSLASQEWTALRKVRRLGLPVPKPVALGERKGLFHREGLLVTEALEDALPLGEYLFGDRRVRGQRRWQVVRGAARLLRRMHDAGVSHRDLHLGNILVRPAASTAELFLIDLQRVDMGASVSQKVRWRDLATLHGGCLEASRTDRLRFLKTYLAGPPPLLIDLKPLVAHLERRGIRHRFRVWRGRRQRCIAENQEFCPVRVGGLTGFARRASWNESLQHLFEGPHGIFSRPGVYLLKDSRTTTAGLVPSPPGVLFVKRYNYQGWGYALKDLFRASRARRVWIAANSLRMRGIPTPIPCAYLKRRRFRVLLESYLITEEVEGIGLVEFARRPCEPGASVLERRRLARQIAILVRRLHERGISHRDLKGQNIFLRGEGAGRYRPFLVDLDGVWLGRVSWRRRVRDLARLARAFPDQSAVTRTDRARFLKAYLGPRGGASWRRLWHSIAMIEARAHRV
ncbi:MAG: lipopolysaccharide kinase InaA family protein [Candidatus Methylomirabilales bacterium]